MAKTINKNENGFASIQFIFLMGFTIFILTGFLNILFIEYNRNSALTSLREAARAGTRLTDLKLAESNPNPNDLNLAINECQTRGDQSLKSLMRVGEMKVICTVSVAAGAASMKAQLQGSPDAAIVPWAIPFANLRLKDLSQSYVQRQAAQ